MKTLVKIAMVAASVASLSSCDWMSNSHSDVPDSTSIVLPKDRASTVPETDSSKIDSVISVSEPSKAK